MAVVRPWNSGCFRPGNTLTAAATPQPHSRALGPVAVRDPVGVALAARLLVAGRARRHAAADAAALEARPGAPVLPRLRAAPHVARAPAVCSHSTAAPTKMPAAERRQATREIFRGGWMGRSRYVRTYVPLAGSTIWCGGGPSGGAGG